MSQSADLLAPAASDPVVDAPRTYQFGRGYTLYALAVLLGVGTFNIIDRTVINLLLVPIGKDLQLSDTQFGFVCRHRVRHFLRAGADPDRAIRRSQSARPHHFDGARVLERDDAAAKLGDRFSHVGADARRRRDRRSGQRSGVDVDDDGSVSTGPSHARVRRYSPRRRRSAAAIGALVAGFAREAIGWRGALMLVGVPGLVYAVIVWRTLREPTRGYFQTGPVEPPADLRQTLRFLLGLPAFRHTLIAYTILVTVAGAQSFDPVYLERVFGFAPKEVGSLLGAVGLLSIVGYYLGGWLCDRMTSARRRAGRCGCRPSSYCFNLAIAIAYYQASSRTVVITLALMVPFLPGVLPIVLATVQNLSPATMRARAAAILLTVSTLVGIGCGAPIAGALSDALTPTYGHEAIRWSLLSIVVTGILWAQLHFWLGSRTLTQNIAAKHART